MSRFRHLSPWYWAMLGVVLLAGLTLTAGVVFGWMPRWLPLVCSIVFLTANGYVFRMLWKQSEPPALRGPNPDRTIPDRRIAPD
jgi:hypothetical protein